jgi:hypothetical protein
MKKSFIWLRGLSVYYATVPCPQYWQDGDEQRCPCPVLRWISLKQRIQLLCYSTSCRKFLKSSPLRRAVGSVVDNDMTDPFSLHESS